MHGRVQGQASEHACGGVTQAIGRPRMRRFVHGQGTQQDCKPRQKRNEIDGWQQADSVPQAPRPGDSVQFNSATLAALVHEYGTTFRGSRPD